MPLSAVKNPSSLPNRVFSMIRSDESIVSQPLQPPDDNASAIRKYSLMIFISIRFSDQKRRLTDSEKLFEKG